MLSRAQRSGEHESESRNSGREILLVNGFALTVQESGSGDTLVVGGASVSPISRQVEYPADGATKPQPPFSLIWNAVRSRFPK